MLLSLKLLIIKHFLSYIINVILEVDLHEIALKIYFDIFGCKNIYCGWIVPDTDGIYEDEKNVSLSFQYHTQQFWIRDLKIYINISLFEAFSSFLSLLFLFLHRFHIHLLFFCLFTFYFISVTSALTLNLHLQLLFYRQYFFFIIKTTCITYTFNFFSFPL